MARFESDSQPLTKKSSKFESFLKKNLDESTYNRIRGYEGCIVCSDTENKQFRKLVLSDECLYFTENPEPKTIKVAVRLEDIFGIELNDQPAAFLSGKEQLNTTHIEINYWSRSHTQDKNNKLKSSKESLTDRKSDAHLDVEHDEIPRRSNSYNLSQLSDDENIISDTLSQSMPESSLKSVLRKNGDVTPRLSSKKVTIDDGRIKKRSLPNPPNGIELSLNGNPSHHSQGSLCESPSSKGDIKSRSNSNLNNSNDTGEIRMGDIVKTRLSVHLYMVVPNSKMLVLIRSAVNNHLIKSTLTIDDDYACRINHSPLRVKHTLEHGGKLSEKIEILFSGLTKELMDSTNSMERTFELIHELKSATEKYFHLKRLFWKTGDLFTLFIQILQNYLPKSPSNVNTDPGRANRADEFELIILVIQTLRLMFRETEIFPSRLAVLKAHSGLHINHLITSLTCFPELPVKYIPPTTKASKLLMQTEVDNWKCLADSEMHELFIEFTSASTSVMFELLVIAQQSHWGRSDTSFFNVRWFMQILEHLDTTEKFLERVIGQAMRFIQPSKNLELSPMEAILVFQDFYILHSVITYSPLLANFIRNNYSEEFRYYIQGPVLYQKLPPRYPISARTILLIEEVMGQVLKRHTPLTFGH